MSEQNPYLLLPTFFSMVAQQDVVDIVSDRVLNIEVHIPKFVSLSLEVVLCYGLSKTGKLSRRRLAAG